MAAAAVTTAPSNGTAGAAAAAGAGAAGGAPQIVVSAAGVQSVAGLDLVNGTFRVWQSAAIGQRLQPVVVKHQPPAPDEVVVKIHASGICATDCDCVAGKWSFFAKHPVVPGHEGVGTVVATGSGVPTTLAIGTRVGLGAFRGACLTCSYCLRGDTNLCASSVAMYQTGEYGTFAEYCRIRYAFAVPIPAAFTDIEAVGPLFCAGATVYAPFVNHHIRAGDRVAVLGVGGLGHLALQIARAWGCHVTALSGTASKREQLLRLGAHDFVDTKADPELKSVAGRFDMLLVCTSAGDTKWNALLSTLRKNGRLVLAGIPTFKDMSISPMLLLFGQLTLAGSAAAGLATYHAMIEFCAQHNIVPTNETFAFDDINEAMERVEAGTVRYRAVVSFTTKPKPTAAAGAAAGAAAAAAGAAVAAAAAKK